MSYFWNMLRLAIFAKHLFYIAFALVLGLYPKQSEGQEKSNSSFFTQRDFGKYLLADHFAPIVKLDLGLGLNFDEYNINTERNQQFVVYNESALGVEIPVFQKTTTNGAWSLSLPLSFSIWFDFTEERTSPILNTDYRFGVVELNYLHRFRNEKFRNINVKFIPLFHESSHIGDELVIQRLVDSLPTARLNVTYNALSCAITLNDAESMYARNQSLSVGARFLYHKNKGWYTGFENEADTNAIGSSTRWIEPHIQYQFQRPDNSFKSGMIMFVASADLSFRVRFGYSIYQKDLNGQIVEVGNIEKYQPCLNLLAGWKFLGKDIKRSNIGAYFRAYSGLNYHGQFRNIPEYQFYGLSLIYEV